MTKLNYTDNNHTGSWYCEDTGKTAFSNKHDARRALTGQLASKAIRVYVCDYEYHWHVTKSYKD